MKQEEQVGRGSARLATAAWLLLGLSLAGLLAVLTNAPAGMAQPAGWAPIEGQSERVGVLTVRVHRAPWSAPRIVEHCAADVGRQRTSYAT